MTQVANLNFRIARLRYQMKATQSDIRLLTNAGMDCAHASERLRRMQADLLALIAERQARTRPASVSPA
jgi:outer membrane murein-binding lipoprotein Lpp